MCTHIRRVVERWARERDLPSEFLAALESDAPWLLCGDGMSEVLASELLEDVFPRFDLGDAEARSLARLLNAHCEFEAPSEVPERLAASEKIEQILFAWNDSSEASGHGMWLCYESTASFKPTIGVARASLPPKRIVGELEAAARECPYYDTLVFVGPSNQELAVIELRPNDG